MPHNTPRHRDIAKLVIAENVSAAERHGETESITVIYQQRWHYYYTGSQSTVDRPS